MSGHSRGHNERTAGSSERMAERLNGAPVQLSGGRIVGKVVVEGQVDDAIGCRGTGRQAIEVLEIAPMHLCPGRRHCPGRGIRTRQAHDLMAGVDELGNNRGTDKTRRTGDEHAHWNLLDVSC
jgi:hypothetical protein